MAINKTDSSVPQKRHDGFEVEPGKDNQYSERFKLKSLDQILREAEEQLGMKFSEIDRKPGIDDGMMPDPSESKFKTRIKDGKITTERRPPALEDDMSPPPALDRSLFGLAKAFADEKGEKVIVKEETPPLKPEGNPMVWREPVYTIKDKNGNELFKGTQREAAEQLQKRGVDVARLPYPEKRGDDKPASFAETEEPKADDKPKAEGGDPVSEARRMEQKIQEGLENRYAATVDDLVYRGNENKFLETRLGRIVTGEMSVQPDITGKKWTEGGLTGSPVESLAMKYNERAFQTEPVKAPALQPQGPSQDQTLVAKVNNNMTLGL